MNARDRILARLRHQPVAPTAKPTAVDAISAADLGGYAPGDPVQSLTRSLQAAHAEVFEITPAELAEKLAELCTTMSLRTLMLPPAGIDLAAWAGGPELRRFDRPLEQHKDALFAEVDAGLTVADCAIADPGMLVLLSSPTQPRTLSLVPPVHICLIDRERIHASLPAALKAENWAAAMPSNLIFISGPSKTADIQQTLAYGAHGPKSLVVLILDRRATN